MVLEEVSYDDCMTFYRNHGYASSEASAVCCSAVATTTTTAERPPL
jgi:hypothetical protein